VPEEQIESHEAFIRALKYLWLDEIADQLGPIDRLVYRSNKLGEDPTLTNTGGGNTSSKIEERDPLTSEPVEVLS
jgi:rhamnose utilization protein RhaD (predicted bifunctional aldolase and dehydrogenase)